jgi:hypothetical protein
MLGPVVTQGLDQELVVAITKTDGTPATGLTFSSVQCQWLRAGDVTFNNKTLTALNFIEKGNGFYGVTFLGAGELNVVGQFVFVVLGAGLQTSQNSAQVVSAASLIPTTPVALPVCTVTGNVNGPDGEGMSGVVISARLVGEPTIEVNVALTDDALTAQTDDNGVFTLTLVRLAVYEIFIPRVNYRRQITVPNLATVNLFTGIA